jgi:hypothetical protein
MRRSQADVQIGPTVEYAYPASLQAAIANDEDLNRLLPFLALPDGAHLVSFRAGDRATLQANQQSEEDYSYFVSLHRRNSSKLTV